MNPEDIRRVGRWPVRGFIGKGGFSWVFEVEDTNLKQRRALKMLRPEAAQGEGFKRFWREARILAAQDEPNLVRILELDRDPETGLDYYVMEYLTGQDLKKLLEQEGALPVERALEIFSGALQGLAHLHGLRPPILHRDIKPANIQITDEGRTKILDLGIARVVRAGDETVAESDLTGFAGFMGSVRYASPEQLRVLEAGPSSDVFSMGLCLFEALEGRHVYDSIPEISGSKGTSTASQGNLYQRVLTYYATLDANRGALPLRFRRTPKPLQAVLKRALSIRPRDRYPDGASMREALRAGTGGRSVERPVEAPRIAPPGGHVRSRRRPIPGVVVVLGAVAALVVVAGVVWLSSRGPGVPRVSPDDVAQVATESEALLEAARGFGAAAEALEPALAKRAQAATLFALGREAEERGDSDGSQVYLRDAKEDFAETCERIAQGFLKPTYEREREGLTRLAASLEAARAQDLRADAWSRLSRALAGIDEAASGAAPCATAAALQERLEAVRALARDAAALERDLEREWPTLARLARTEAEEAERALAARAVDAPEFAEAVTRGHRAIQDGDAAREAGSHPVARDAYRIAMDSFREADEILGAVVARERAQGLAAEAAVRDLASPADRERIAEADARFADRRWRDATSDYEQAAKWLQLSIERSRELEPVREAEKTTRVARQAAEETGAANSAAEQFRAAEDALAHAETLVGAGRFDDARAAFGEARAAFERSAETASKELEEARSEGAKARGLLVGLAPGEACTNLAPLIQEECERGRSELERGDQAVASRDAHTALARYGSAREALERANETGRRLGPAEQSRVAAERAREKGQRSAARAANVEIAEAEAHWQEGLRALEAVRLEEAQQAFDAARAGFEAAVAKGELEIANAQEAGKAAHAARAVCDRPPSGTATDCEAVAAAIAAGDTALEQGDTTAALAAYASARGAIARVEALVVQRAPADRERLAAEESRTAARQAGAAEAAPEALAAGEARWADAERVLAERRFEEAQRAFAEARQAFESARDRALAAKPRPPEIAKRSPARSQVTARSGEQLRFEVSARDPNPDEPLRYVWTVDGREQRTTGPAFELLAERNASVVVQVVDPGGLLATTRWDLTVGVRPLSLSLSPAGRGDLRLQVGEEVTLRAAARDAAVGEVETVFLLDGKVVNEGSTYVFRGDAVGSHRIEVRATDASGAIGSVQRRIVVVAPPAENAAPKLVSRSPSSAIVRAARDQQLTFSVRAEDPEKDAISYRWTLAGKPVGGAGPRLSLPVDTSGELRVRVTDAAGGATEASLTLEVQAAAAGIDASAVASAALGEYRAAYEARDIKRLARIWQMNTHQRDSLTDFFRSTDTLSISLEPGEAKLDGDRISVSFRQRIRAPGVPEARAVYVAVLVEAAPEQWQIEKLTAK